MPLVRARRTAIRGLALLCGLVGMLPAFAQLPVSRLSSLFPPGITIGVTNEITVTGEYLDEPAALLFSGPGIMAVPKAGVANVFVVVVSTNVLPAYMDVRFAGRFGVSNPRAIAVVGAPELLSPGSNTALTNAFDVPLGRVINGRVAPASDQWFHFAVKLGQRVIARVESTAIDSRLEPVLTLYSSDGRELGRARRGVLDFTPPADGHFTLKLHDGTYRGGDDYTYRLELSTAPHLEFAVPPAIQSGATNRAVIFGRNLPGSQRSSVLGGDGRPLEQLEVEISGLKDTPFGVGPIEILPRALALGGDAVSWRFSAMNGLSDSVAFGVASGSTVGAPTSAVAHVTLPCEYGGLFPRRHEFSGVQFEAKKDSSWRVELISDRLGSRTAAGLMLQRIKKDSKGVETYSDVEEIKDGARHFDDRDFNTASRDISSSMHMSEDGSYRLVARDYFHLGDTGPQYPYWLRITPDAPDFWVGAVSAIPPKSADADRKVHINTSCLRPGETVALRVYVVRHNLDADIDLVATNLPAGVFSVPARIASGQHTGTLLLTAREGLPDTNAAIQIVARATVDNKDIVRVAKTTTATVPVADYDDEPVVTRLVREQIVSVASQEIAPITIAAEGPGPYEVASGGQIKIPLRVKKRLDFTGNPKLKPMGHSGLDKAKEVEINLGTTNATMELNLSETSLPEGLHTIWLQGSATVKYRSFVEGLVAAEAELDATTKAVAAAKPDEKKAAEEKLKAATERKKAAEERAKPRDIPVMIYTEPFYLKVIPAGKTPAKS